MQSFYYSQAMKQEYCHAECEGGLDFVTQEKQEHNL
jgi:putative component of membrane protein insertase Oxa1/YidC/SpoIIIJ protein YidD